jgi:hypothetical protein
VYRFVVIRTKPLEDKVGRSLREAFAVVPDSVAFFLVHRQTP